MASSSGATCSGSHAEHARRSRASSSRGGVGELQRPLGAAERGDGLGEPGDGVVVQSREPCAARAARDEPDPDQRLLARLQQVGALVADGDRVAADLADRLGGAVEDSGCWSTSQLAPTPPPSSSSAKNATTRSRSGCSPEPRMSRERGRGSSRPCPSCRRRRGPTASRRGSRRRTGRRSSCSASAGTTSRWPCRRVRAWSGRVPGTRATTLVRPRLGLEELGSRPSAASLRLDVLGGLALPVRPPVAVIRRVESDEIAGDHRGLVELGDRLLDCG